MLDAVQEEQAESDWYRALELNSPSPHPLSLGGLLSVRRHDVRTIRRDGETPRSEGNTTLLAGRRWVGVYPWGLSSFLQRPQLKGASCCIIICIVITFCPLSSCLSGKSRLMNIWTLLIDVRLTTAVQ